MAISSVQTSNVGVIGSSSISLNFLGATTAGNLLVAVVGSSSINQPTTTASGWLTAVSKGSTLQGSVAIWYKPNCAASEPSVTFTSSGSLGMAGFLMEFSGAQTSSVLDQTNSNSGFSGGSVISCTNSAADTGPQDLVISANTFIMSMSDTMSPVDTWTAGSGGLEAVAKGYISTKDTFHFWGSAFIISGGGGVSADSVSISTNPSTGTFQDGAVATASFKALLGTTFNQTVSASVLTSASVALHKAFGRTVSATVSTSVGLARSIAHVVKATPATAVSIARAITKTPISATVTTAAGVARSVGKTVKATVTTAASVATTKAKNITVAATVATSAAVKRTVSHAVSASASTAAKVTRAVGHTVSATASTAAKVSRVVSHAVSTTVATAVTVAANLGSSAIHITVSATVSTSVALSRVISRFVSATANTSIGLIFSKLFPGFFHVCVEVVANLFGRGSVSNRNSGAGSVSARVTTSNGPQSSITAKPQAPNRIGES